MALPRNTQVKARPIVHLAQRLGVSLLPNSLVLFPETLLTSLSSLLSIFYRCGTSKLRERELNLIQEPVSDKLLCLYLTTYRIS